MAVAQETPAKVISTEDAIEGFLEDRESKGRSAALIAAYKWALGEFARTYPGPLPEDKRQVRSYLAKLTRLSLRSRWNQWRMIRTFYAFCAEEFDVPNAAAKVEAPKLPKGEPKMLTTAQVEALLAEDLSRRDRAILSLFLDTGLRLGELANLTREEISENIITVTGKTGRHYTSLSPAASQALIGVTLPWRGERGTLTRSGVQQVVRRALRRAGIAEGGPHRLRHTFACHYVLQGGDFASLQSILGHANPSSTYMYTKLPLPQIVRQKEKYATLLLQGA